VDWLVASVNTSAEKGTEKLPVAFVDVDLDGIVGDAHRGTSGRGVSLLDAGAVEAFREETGMTLAPGAFGENITARGLQASALSPGDRLVIGTVELEVTAIGKTCHGSSCSVFRRAGRCVMPLEGVFCRVIRGGRIAPGDRGRTLPRASR
jgi:MOSC domain-containing protein YiiM